jgi:hypothetical protein
MVYGGKHLSESFVSVALFCREHDSARMCLCVWLVGLGRKEEYMKLYFVGTRM